MIIILLLLLLIPNVSLATIPTALGWTEITGGTLQAQCPANNFGGWGYNFYDQCHAITTAWNSASFDTSRNKLMVWGGGHTDYGGNEIYTFDGSTLTRINNPAQPIYGCTDNSSTPQSRHTYDGIAYMSNVDAMFVNGGALYALNGCEADHSIVWIYKVATATWERHTPTISGSSPDPATNGNTTAYDANTGLVFFTTRIGTLFSYDYSSDTITSRHSGSGCNYRQTAVVDIDRKLYICLGAGYIQSFDITPGGSYNYTEPTPGSNGCINTEGPGAAYDPLHHRIVCWVSGSTVWFLDTGTWAWTSTTAAGTPPPSYTGGSGSNDYLYKRFSYSPSLGVFFVYTATDVNGYILRLDTPEDVDFLQRCTAAGVTRCVGFENTTTDIVQGVNLFPADAGYRGHLDTSVKKSGTGSLRFDQLQGELDMSISGYWQPASGALYPPLGATYGSNSTLYFQYAYRFDDAFWSNRQIWPEANKVHIVWAGTNSCATLQQVTGLGPLTVNWSPGISFSGYTQCGGSPGSRGLFTNIDGQTLENSSSILYQQGVYACQYHETNSADCWQPPANKWITFYYKFTIGTFTSNNAPGTVEGWYAINGGAYTKWLNVTQNFDWNKDSGDTGFYQFMFTVYMTNMSVAVPQDSHVWYDELIVSTQPIAAPGQSGSSSTPVVSSLGSSKTLNIGGGKTFNVGSQ